MIAFNVDATVAGVDEDAFDGIGGVDDEGLVGTRSASGQRAGCVDEVAGSSKANELARAAAPQRTGLALARTDSDEV